MNECAGLFVVCGCLLEFSEFLEFLNFEFLNFGPGTELVQNQLTD